MGQRSPVFRRLRNAVAETAEAAALQPPPHYIIIHHTDIGQQEHPKQLELVNQSHQRRGYELSKRGYYVAYHYLIEADGTIIHTRDNTERTVHTKCGMDWGFEKCKNGYLNINEDSLAIVLAGNFEEEQSTKQQLRSLKKLTKELQEEYTIPTSHILPHKAVSPTKCAGMNLLHELWGNKYD